MSPRPIVRWQLLRIRSRREVQLEFKYGCRPQQLEGTLGSATVAKSRGCSACLLIDEHRENRFPEGPCD
jgi:hypothetical protein